MNDEKIWLETEDGQKLFIIKSEKIDMQKELNKTIENLYQELQRKDNIINELEKWLNEMLKHNKECLEEERGTGHQTLDIIAFNRSAYIKIWENVLDKLKELKEKV